ncbi:ribonuclease domain-containing protein [Corynebacterium sp. Q4381]|uniref:ribonuclease domain-containing protein n=1 Tax=Corynebacterium sp. Marseille-Q4381 TaxID=3121597 RepID=UPI002FE5547D
MRKGWVLAAAALLVAGCAAPVETETEIPACERLPAQAEETIEVIERGGPYKYPANDDQRFGNYEGHLPEESLGYYREYTVDTPGVNHRGARRIITGGEGAGREWYYTADHYESFCEIAR